MSDELTRGAVFSQCSPANPLKHKHLPTSHPRGTRTILDADALVGAIVAVGTLFLAVFPVEIENTIALSRSTSNSNRTSTGCTGPSRYSPSYNRS